MEAVKKRVELEERIQALENEETSLAAEVEALRVIPSLTERASTLESAVTKLREEKKGLLMRANSALESRGEPSIAEKNLETYQKESGTSSQPPSRGISKSKPDPENIGDSERPQDPSQIPPAERNQQAEDVERNLPEDQADDSKPKSTKEYIAPFARQVTRKVGQTIVEVTQDVDQP